MKPNGTKTHAKTLTSNGRKGPGGLGRDAVVIFIAGRQAAQKICTGKVNSLLVAPEDFPLKYREQSRLKIVFGNLFFAVAPFLNNSLLLADPTLSGRILMSDFDSLHTLASGHLFFYESSEDGQYAQEIFCA